MSRDSRGDVKEIRIRKWRRILLRCCYCCASSGKKTESVANFFLIPFPRQCKTSCAGRPPQYAPCKLTFEVLTLKVVSESRVTWATSVPILVLLGLSVLDLGPMYATDRQTSDVRISKGNFATAELGNFTFADNSRNFSETFEKYEDVSLATKHSISVLIRIREFFDGIFFRANCKNVAHSVASGG